MTDATARIPADRERRLRRRYAAERRFRLYGATAVCVAVTVLLLLLGSIVAQGYSAFVEHEIALDVTFDPAVIDPQGTSEPAVLTRAPYGTLVRDALLAQFPDVKSRQDRPRQPGPATNAPDVAPIRSAPGSDRVWQDMRVSDDAVCV